MRKVLATRLVGTDTFELTRATRLSYFTPSGRARLKINTSYHVENADPMSYSDQRNRHWYTSKAEALKYFRALSGPVTFTRVSNE